MIRATATIVALVIMLSFPAVATAALYANVIAVNFNGGTTVDVVVSILKGIDNAARNGNADFGVRVTVTYVSQQGTVETLDSGRVSTRDTTFAFSLGSRTVAIILNIPIGTTPAPGPNPSFSATVQVLHKDPATGTDDALGPPEESFP